MKSKFSEYYKLNDEELSDIWRNGIIVADTNVLLRIFRYKKKTADDFIAILEKFGDRLWIPYQVAWEFQRRRISKIDESRKSYKEIMDAFKDCMRRIEAELNLLKEFGVHPLVDLETDIRSVIDNLSASMIKLEGSYNSVPTSGHYDNIFNRITALYDGKVGESPSDEEMEKVFSEGALRYSQKIPPGFKDEKSKQHNQKRELYGDLLIWKEIIDKSLSEGRGVIFITEDLKEDWWERSIDGKTIGPLPALKKEFYQNAGQLFHMYRAGIFAERAAKAHNLEIDANSAEEIKQEIPKDHSALEGGRSISFEEIVSVLQENVSNSGYIIENNKKFRKNYQNRVTSYEDLEALKSDLVKKYLGIDQEKYQDNNIEINNCKRKMRKIEFYIEDRLNRNGFDYNDSDVQKWTFERDQLKKKLSEL